jgi:hypothetical protein
MSFLKSFGTILARIIGVVAGVSGVINPLLDQHAQTVATNVQDKATQILQAVMNVEASFAAVWPTTQNGAQKLQAATALVGPILAQVDQISGRKIANEANWVAAVKTITGGVADLLNSYEGVQPAGRSGTGS